MIAFGIATGVAAAGAHAASPAPAPAPSLDESVTFADSSMCYLSDETETLLAGMVAWDPQFLHEEGYVRPGTVPDRLRDRLGPVTLVSNDGWWVIRTEAKGTLWGLPLSAIEQDFPVGGDPGGFTLVFDAPIAAVEVAARARGLPARAGQTVQLGEPDGYAYDISLEPSGDTARQSRLSCGYS